MFKISGNPHPFKSVRCKAISDAVVIKLAAASFIDVFDQNPDMLIKIVQLIMVRLQRVTFVALHQYLGLSNELVRQDRSCQPSEALNIPSSGESTYEKRLDEAVRGFRNELDFDNVEFLRERCEICNYY